jgi:hypothetical protein
MTSVISYGQESESDILARGYYTATLSQYSQGPGRPNRASSRPSLGKMKFQIAALH